MLSVSHVDLTFWFTQLNKPVQFQQVKHQSDSLPWTTDHSVNALNIARMDKTQTSGVDHQQNFDILRKQEGYAKK